MSRKIVINERLWLRVSAIQKEATKDKKQHVPDMFVGIALSFADKQQKKRIYLGREIYTMAQQLHKEWLIRHVRFQEKNGHPIFYCVPH